VFHQHLKSGRILTIGSQRDFSRIGTRVALPAAGDGGVRPMNRPKNWMWRAALALSMIVMMSARARATERLCDASFEDCRAPLINLIRNENVGIDVAFWFMEDARYSAEIIRRWQAGVPVRVIIDQRAFPELGGAHPVDKQIVDTLVAAGIPIRQRNLANKDILHWKMMLFAGQNTVEFSGANYSSTAFVPQQPYVDFEDEAILFTDDPIVVNSFKTKYDDLWVDNTVYLDYANLINPPARVYPIYTKDPELNFPQQESYASRLLGRYPKEQQQIDVIMFRISDERETNAVIAAVQRGIPVRLITDLDEYREPSRQWVSYNLDKMWAAGVQFRVRAHAGLNHQKLVLFHRNAVNPMSVFGSSNWTGPSDNRQQEHNYFTQKQWIFDWFLAMFERKWTNSNPAGSIETVDFVPLPPDKPLNSSPVNAAASLATTGISLKWNGGWYAHYYDVYFGTDANPPLYAANLFLGPTDFDTPKTIQKLTLPTLQPGTTYYWRVVGRTMAGLTAKGPTWSFTTKGTPPPPPPPPPGATTQVIWAKDVQPSAVFGAWQFLTDPTAVGGIALWNKDAGKAKISPPLAAPANYFEATFTATAGVPYHLWIRMRAQSNSTSNGSVSAQFSDSSDAFGSPSYRIGSGSGAEVLLQDGTSGTLSGWGWADNGYGVFGSDIYFATTGTHTIRIQQRNDGPIVDQIVVSPDTWVRNPPGTPKNDATFLDSTISGAPGGGPAPLPQPWQRTDVGTVGINGLASFDAGSGSFAVVGGGGDIWGSADGMYFAYQPLDGDGSIVARITGVQNTNAWARAGIMIRESLGAAAPNAFVYLAPSKTMAFQRRRSSSDTTYATAGSTSSAAPLWVRLDRAGNTFSAYRSSDGINWLHVGSDAVAMAGQVLIGLAVTSANLTAANASTFDNVTVAAGTPVPPAMPPPAPPLPDGWQHRDVGPVGFTGDAAYDTGSHAFTLKGAGANIGGSADAFQFAYRTMTGDGVVYARVKSLANTSSTAKAGVMIRASVDDGAPMAFAGVTPGSGTVFVRRHLSDDATASTSGIATAKPPYFVKLERIGNTFSAYQSADGMAWSLIGSDTVAMASTVYVGLAVTSKVLTNPAATVMDFVNLPGFSSGVPTPPPPPPGPLPESWANADIGTVGKAGTSLYETANGTFHVSGAGSDVWGIADSFQFAYRIMNGDGWIAARVAGMTNANSYTKAGVMMRETLDSGSVNVYTEVSLTKGTAFQRRKTPGGSTSTTAGPAAAPPYWIKLERSGSVFNSYMSADGAAWTLVGSQTIAMSATVYVGLAVTSHTTATVATARFDGVSGSW
jgi:regulation of enolase protein 1 (concanavalin A-like superfamily)